MAKISNGQRAVWMVLITWLIAPFLAGLAAALIALAGMALGPIAPFSGVSIGEAAAGAFVWSALPAAVAGLGLIPFVLERGGYGWLHAAVAGVAGFFAGIMIQPIAATPLMPAFAFAAGLILVIVRAMLVRRGILKS